MSGGYEKFTAALTGALQTILDWETEFRDRGLKPMTTGDPSEGRRRRRRVAAWLWRLGGVCVALIVLASVLHSRIVWGIYTVVQLAFLAMAVVAIKLRDTAPSK
ncbi:MAG TPA: hypothetical protein VEB65_08520 [Solirubrobacterales bacterium]|nr:hypothetical protein [Solirubrobacterales bacterium]